MTSFDILVLSVASAFCCSVAGAEDLESPPLPVQTFWNSVTIAVTDSTSEDSTSLAFKFEPTFWTPANGFKGVPEAWLVGSKVATDKRSHYNVVAIVDASGRQLFNPGGDYLKTEVGFPFLTSKITDGKFVNIGEGEQMVAFALSSGDSRNPGQIELQLLSPEQKTILSDRGRSDDETVQSLFWEGGYYPFASG